MRDFDSEYITRVYEPYVYLMTKGTVNLEFKGDETIILFRTTKGIVRYFEEYFVNGMSVEDYYGDPDVKVDYVTVSHPGRYTMVDVSDSVYVNYTNSHLATKIYGRFYRNPTNHKVYGDYIGWAYSENQEARDSYATNFTSKMTLNANGKIGMGVTPQNLMECEYCGGITNDVDIEYLWGTNHLECELKNNKP